MRPKFTSKVTWALALAGAVFVLSVLAGPDTVHHLGVAPRDFHSCSLYQWAHGANAGATSSFVLTAALPFTGSAVSPSPIAAPDVSAHPTPSRAPPAIV